MNKESEEKMREKDIMLRQKTEEVEALQLNNSRLVKRIDSLVEDTKKSTIVFFSINRFKRMKMDPLLSILYCTAGKRTS